MNERKLDIAKRIIKERYNEACCGIFDSRNIVGDSMNNIYDDGELSIDICYHWSYFEVFGLSNDDFTELRKFYESLYTACDERCPMYECCCDQPSDNIEDWLKQEANDEH